jgi:hypothetical protein
VLDADSGGVIVTAIGGGHEVVTSVLVQPEGKIVAAWQADNGSNSADVNVDFAVIRVLP